MPSFAQKITQPIAVQGTISAGTSLSAPINLKGYTLSILLLPAAWTTANITLQVSYDGITYYNLYNQDGTEYTIIAAINRAVVVQPSDLAAVEYIKLRSGTAGTPIIQVADALITMVAIDV